MSRKTLQMTDQLYDYLLGVSLRESSVQRELRETTARLANANMQISPEQGQFMALLVSAIGARRALEIGVFTGYSALSVAQALPDDGRLIACDVNEEWTDMAREYWSRAGVENKIDLRIRPALQTLGTLVAEGMTGTFDFAFIDADKINYQAYYEACLMLVRPGGLIAIDNVLWSGDVVNSEKNDEDTLAIRKLNLALRDDERVDLSLVPIADGLTILRKRA
jgi:predicted O-methyltransferase YrrM